MQNQTLIERLRGNETLYSGWTVTADVIAVGAVAAAGVDYVVVDLQHGGATERSEEHTSELQSLRHLVCRLLLEKKKKVPSSEPARGCLPPRCTGSLPSARASDC